MAWTVVLGSSQDGSNGNEIWAYDNTATTANTYPASMHLSRANGSDASGIRTFDPPGATPAQATYVRCRMVVDSVERGELSWNYFEERRP